MKKNIALQLGMIVCTVLAGLLFAMHKSVYLFLFILLVQLLLSIVCIFGMVKMNQLMVFLIAENKMKSDKKRGSNDVIWDEEELEKLKLVRKRVELSTLQSQINPHFLYNTLDSIRSKALLDGQTEIASMTEILSKFFRYCITNEGNLVTVREEINHINDYYYIQKYRFEDKLQMKIEVESDEIYDLYIPKMTLQPLVENAMIHGLEKLARQGMVTIRIIQTREKLVIIISDNGAGMSVEQLEQLNHRMNSQHMDAGVKGKRHNGIALNNVNSRIKITFGDDYGIHYRSIEGSGTEAVVTMPRIDEFRRVKYGNIL